ncbi:hypothetical protein RHGRI_025012 [Rhododendron griersonianum]|uniref:Uncharacterized protein n=1 Tax=Rhododendron griersonianum TaxID=479676 RepID=A0AAV6J9E7_9ERIC|nr:hypothetical protein RHGRI_025012 [Rhododendron griersonianum]
MLRSHWKMIWGCERKWVFEVFILDNRDCHVLYDWSYVNPNWMNFHPFACK